MSDVCMAALLQLAACCLHHSPDLPRGAPASRHFQTNVGISILFELEKRERVFAILGPRVADRRERGFTVISLFICLAINELLSRSAICD
jgi:hypothetical protein